VGAYRAHRPGQRTVSRIDTEHHASGVGQPPISRC
jgi:hypothetical protein